MCYIIVSTVWWTWWD